LGDLVDPVLGHFSPPAVRGPLVSRTAMKLFGPALAGPAVGLRQAGPYQLRGRSAVGADRYPHPARQGTDPPHGARTVGMDRQGRLRQTIV